jgi:subtilisin family serine protease
MSQRSRNHSAAFLLALAAGAALVIAPFSQAAAQKMETPMRGGMGGDRGHRGGGMGGAGLIGLGVGIATGVILSQRPVAATEQPQPRAGRNAAPRQRNARSGSGVPAAGETRMVSDEVVIEISNATSAQTVNTIRQRSRLTLLESQSFALTGTTFYRWQIPDRRSVASVVRTLEGDTRIASAQPNYLFTLQEDAPPQQEQPGAVTANAKPEAADTKLQGAETKPKYDPAQYAVAKMRLDEAHGLANGDNILVAVIDSGVDASHPELAGAVADSFDTLKAPFKPHDHGTAIAALIAGRERLMGASPAARILAVRTFDPAGSSAEATTFNILKGLDWSVAHGARIINMSFAGPADPAIHRSLEAAHKKSAVLIAAAGNAGPKSPPLYPAADPNVIAVTATDSADKLFAGANRGRHIALAAPGVDVLVAVPNGGYQVSTGTSYSAAEVSGIAALLLQYKGPLTPDQVRNGLTATAKDLGPSGRDDDFGAGLTDAYRALTEGTRTSAAAAPAK